jgi:transposase
MVKFQEYFVKKSREFGGKFYEYRGVLLRVPKKFHVKIDGFVGVDLAVQNIIVSKFNQGHTITLILSTTTKVSQGSGSELLKQLGAKVG